MDLGNTYSDSQRNALLQETGEGLKQCVFLIKICFMYCPFEEPNDILILRQPLCFSNVVISVHSATS